MNIIESFRDYRKTWEGTATQPGPHSVLMNFEWTLSTSIQKWKDH